MMTEDEENRKKYEQGMKNPKNRFLFFMCHANEVDNGWGRGWSFKCGVIFFSVLMLIIVIEDIIVSICNGYLQAGKSTSASWYVFYAIKGLANFIALPGIGFAIAAVRKQSYRYCTIAYYIYVVTFLLNTIFIIYCIIAIFTINFWKIVGFHIISFVCCEIVSLLYTWMLFCFMVNLSRKIREEKEKAQNFI